VTRRLRRFDPRAGPGRSRHSTAKRGGSTRDCRRKHRRASLGLAERCAAARPRRGHCARGECGRRALSDQPVLRAPLRAGPASSSVTRRWRKPRSGPGSAYCRRSFRRRKRGGRW